MGSITVQDLLLCCLATRGACVVSTLQCIRVRFQQKHMLRGGKKGGLGVQLNELTVTFFFLA